MDLLYARAQMGLSLAFHIVFAAVGVALPVLMVLSELAHRRTGDPVYLELAKRLAKGTAILFAVGAVSGTVLSFELGLLWPEFMGQFGDIIGLPFALEGYAFFTEAIFLGIYLYGRERVSPNLHLFSGIAVAASGAASAFFVTLVNAFMNDPAGIGFENGAITWVKPLQAMFSPSWSHQTLHVLISCYQATAFAMAGLHAFLLLRQPESALHKRALGLALGMACVTALLQPLSGDLSARHVAERQPVKLAAMEAHFETSRGAPLMLGGWPDEETGEVPYGLKLPYGLSLLAFHDPNAEVKGLREFPRDQWPPVRKVHLAFQVMVGTGMMMAALAVFTAAFLAVRRRLPRARAYLWAVVACGPLGVIAMEAGWLVTEWGRQPWVVKGLLLTADAVTPQQNLAVPFWTFTVVYLLLGVAVVYLLRQQLRAASEPTSKAEVSYGS